MQNVDMFGVPEGARVLLCQCGCGETFYQSRVGRVRKYKNETHKSRANNQRTRTLVQRGKSIKDAVLFRNICDNMETEDICAWFPDLTNEQWIVIDAIRNSTLTYDTFAALLTEMAAW